MPPNEEELRSSLIRRLQTARDSTNSLFSMLDPEAITSLPIRERHRIIFYLGHIEAFDWNLLARTAMGVDPFNESFDRLFAFGIGPVNRSLPIDKPSDWPPLAQVIAYNRRIRDTVDDFLIRIDFGDSEKVHNGLVFEVVIEHRMMHAETFAYMLHWLPVESKKSPQVVKPALVVRPARRDPIEIPEGFATISQSRGDRFGWDNEFGEVQTRVSAFSIDRNNVTNGRFLGFVLSGGYDDRTLWTDEDWEWKQQANFDHPRFWCRNPDDHDACMIRNIFDVRPLPMSCPVYINHAEASAYAKWKGPAPRSEGKLHRAAYGTPDGVEQAYPWGPDSPDPERRHFDSHHWDPAPIGSFPGGDGAFGVADLVGNGWEWYSTIFEAFDGFERFPFYPGYSADFFDGQHYGMKGGSSRTTASMLRRSFRNWFQPHYPHIYSAFRLVEV